MLPRSGRRTPSTHSIVVVFPAPFGPIKPKTSPSLTSNETSERATVVPYLRVMPTTLTLVAPTMCAAVVDADERVIRDMGRSSYSPLEQRRINHRPADYSRTGCHHMVGSRRAWSFEVR